MKALIGALALVAVLAVAGCGSSGGDESVAESGGEDPALAYTECMRENGISDFPEPVEGQLKIEAGPGSDLNPESPAFQKAEDACRSLAPPHEASPGQEEELSASALAYAECMRENGVSGFPDPEVSGGKIKMGIPRGIDPESPAFQKAEEACRELMVGPGGPGAGQ